MTPFAYGNNGYYNGYYGGMSPFMGAVPYGTLARVRSDLQAHETGTKFGLAGAGIGAAISMAIIGFSTGGLGLVAAAAVGALGGGFAGKEAGEGYSRLADRMDNGIPDGSQLAGHHSGYGPVMQMPGFFYG